MQKTTSSVTSLLITHLGLFVSLLGLIVPSITLPLIFSATSKPLQSLQKNVNISLNYNAASPSKSFSFSSTGVCRSFFFETGMFKCTEMSNEFISSLTLSLSVRRMDLVFGSFSCSAPLSTAVVTLSNGASQRWIEPIYYYITWIIIFFSLFPPPCIINDRNRFIKSDSQLKHSCAGNWNTEWAHPA